MNMAAFLFLFIFILLQLFARNTGGRDEDDQRGTMTMIQRSEPTMSSHPSRESFTPYGASDSDSNSVANRGSDHGLDYGSDGTVIVNTYPLWCCELEVTDRPA